MIALEIVGGLIVATAFGVGVYRILVYMAPSEPAPPPAPVPAIKKRRARK